MFQKVGMSIGTVVTSAIVREVAAVRGAESRWDHAPAAKPRVIGINHTQWWDQDTGEHNRAISELSSTVPCTDPALNTRTMAMVTPISTRTTEAIQISSTTSWFSCMRRLSMPRIDWLVM